MNFAATDDEGLAVKEEVLVTNREGVSGFDGASEFGCQRDCAQGGQVGKLTKRAGHEFVFREFSEGSGLETAFTNDG